MGVIVLLLAVFFLVSGCSRPIVKPNAPGDSGVAVGPYQGGSVNEQELQAVQANLKTVYFDYDKFDLSPEAHAALQYNADIINRAPNTKIVAEGHCDDRGTDEYNLALGERRARSVVNFLTGVGISPQRVSTVSYGSELPVDTAHNEAAWAKNRRVYLRVSR